MSDSPLTGAEIAFLEWLCPMRERTHVVRGFAARSPILTRNARTLALAVPDDRHGFTDSAEIPDRLATDLEDVLQSLDRRGYVRVRPSVGDMSEGEGFSPCRSKPPDRQWPALFKRIALVRAARSKPRRGRAAPKDVNAALRAMCRRPAGMELFSLQDVQVQATPKGCAALATERLRAQDEAARGGGNGGGRPKGRVTKKSKGGRPRIKGETERERLKLCADYLARPDGYSLKAWAEEHRYSPRHVRTCLNWERRRRTRDHG